MGIVLMGAWCNSPGNAQEVRRMVMKSSKTGMVYPDSIAKKDEPPRKYGLLEIQDEDDRKVAHKAFQSMILSHICHSSGIRISGPGINETRMRMVKDMARLFLGDDCEFEEWC